MSGTSLDGVDMALCKFTFKEEWQYTICNWATIVYPQELLERLKSAFSFSGEDLALLHSDLGRFLGEQARLFLNTTNKQVDIIASHGHTVFHNPDKGYTLQIGNGAEIAVRSGVKTVCDFRTLDVARGGQGAPLVPIGDKLLFSKYAACLNLGGFANISFDNQVGERIAYDICPVNFVLNRLSERLGFKYDLNGDLAREGNVDLSLLEVLNKNPYFSKKAPKSLGQEWVEENVLDYLSTSSDTRDLLKTYCEHIAFQLSSCFNEVPGRKILVTGGGVNNLFLMDLLRSKTDYNIVIPDKEIIEMKEALIFAFLGVLRIREEANSLKSVTGATNNSINGAIYLP